MAKQLIFCSVPHGLQPGRSGYCLMAGHTDLPQSLIRQLEQETSVFPPIEDEDHAPTYEVRRSGGIEWHLFMRQTTGIKDYTGRSSGLTHVLVERAENFPSYVDPKTVLWTFKNWVTGLPDEPYAFGSEEEIDLSGLVAKVAPPATPEVQPEEAPVLPKELFKPIAVTPRAKPRPRPRSGIYYDGPKRRRKRKWFIGLGAAAVVLVVVVMII